MSGVEVAGLRVGLAGTPFDIVGEIAFAIRPGRILGLVGESGSGKTTVGQAMLGFCRPGAVITAGSVRVDGQDVLGGDENRRQSLRGRVVTYVPQDPGVSLNPALRAGEQLEEMLVRHCPGMARSERAARMEQALTDVSLPVGPATLRRYPHQFSGGQQQRIALAIAFLCQPRMIVLDEPTTGLDVTTQAHVLQTVRRLCTSHGVAALYVSHDLAVVAGLADDVAVMYAGRVVETGPTALVFRAPAHPYTRRLLAAVPDPAGRHAVTGIPGHAPAPQARPAGCSFVPRCDRASERCQHESPPAMPAGPSRQARCWHADPAPPPILALSPRPAWSDAPDILSVSRLDAAYGAYRVLHGVTFGLKEGECLALVGESGSGKTTLARCIAGLHGGSSGLIGFRGRTLPQGVRQRTRQDRQAIQYVFQNPYASLNPRRCVGDSIARPLHIFFDLTPAEIARRVADALGLVALAPGTAGRFPGQLSGGERQRVAIARALAAAPDLLVCDEVTSALDVSVQATVMELLVGLRQSTRLSMLFVTHNLPLVRVVADRVAVMQAGHIVECGATADIFDAPQHEYTRALLADVAPFAHAIT